MYGSITRSGFLAFAGLLVILGNAVADERQSIGTIERGKYLATAADCTACHTRSGGKLFAGGVNLQTPFGRLVGANITPNPAAGIGDWTDDEFVSALRDGRGRGGKRLYPAMPYPAFTKMTREDALAIRAYLRSIEPVPDRLESNQLPFPFNIRSAMAVWNMINFQPGQERPIRRSPANGIEDTISLMRSVIAALVIRQKTSWGPTRGPRIFKAAYCKAGTLQTSRGRHAAASVNGRSRNWWLISKQERTLIRWRLAAWAKRLCIHPLT